MRIVVVAASLDAASGGTSEAIRRMAEAIAFRGHSVTLVQVPAEVPARGEGSPRSTVLERVLLRKGPGAFSPRTRTVLREEIAACDLLHTHGLWQHPSWAAGVEALRSGRPIVLSPHGSLSPWALAYKPWRKRVALAVWGRRLLAQSSVLVATGEREAMDLRSFDPGAVVEVVPHGIELPDGAWAPLEPSASGRGPRIGFLGRVHPVKAVAELAEAVGGLAREFPGIHLAIGGPWENGYRRSIEERTDGRPGAEIEWAGLLASDEKWEFLRGCDVVALPSHVESFGLAAGEALGVGKPVVVGRNTAWSFVEEAGLGAVVDPTAASISDGLRRVLRSGSLAAHVAVEGPRFIRESYGWHRAGERLEKVYAGALRFRSSRKANAK